MMVGMAVETTVDSKEASAVTSTRAKVTARTRPGAKRAAAALDALEGQGCAPVGVVVLTAAGRALPALESVLGSHALIHAADGEHFREALAAAAQARGLPVTRVRERDVLDRARSALGRPASE